MASKFLRRQKWWVKLRHPITGESIRESLETGDPARAELLRQRLDLEVALLDPRFQMHELPKAIVGRLGLSAANPALLETSVAAPTPTAFVASAPRPKKRTTVDEAVSAYLKFIAAENAPLHVANKVSILRRFLGAERLEKAGGPAKTKRPRDKKGQPIPDVAPYFTGTTLEEITPALVQDFLEGLGVGRKTMRHYRETFHHFFGFCLNFDLYVPTNFHRPNPIAALPSYVSRNQRIVFLSQAEIDTQLAILSDDPALQIAVALMIYGGLRRAETLWLTPASIAVDLGYLSVLNRRDEADDIESSLKTGERSVTILPPLRAALEAYLPQVKTKWLIPKSDGGRWRPDCFSARLRGLNRQAGLPWTCLPYRHTYATQRAAEGWPLFRIAKEMGNSATVVEEYYAGYIRPAELSSVV